MARPQAKHRKGKARQVTRLPVVGSCRISIGPNECSRLRSGSRQYARLRLRGEAMAPSRKTPWFLLAGNDAIKPLSRDQA